jgi:hypothetical protein
MQSHWLHWAEGSLCSRIGSIGLRARASYFSRLSSLIRLAENFI